MYYFNKPKGKQKKKNTPTVNVHFVIKKRKKSLKKICSLYRHANIVKCEMFYKIMQMQPSFSLVFHFLILLQPIE